MNPSKEEVIAFLRRCTGGEFSDVMRQAMADRPEAAPEGEAFEHRLFLGMASR